MIVVVLDDITHTELPASEVELGGHFKHEECDVAPASSEYLSAPHLMQSANPDAILYLPATHCVQIQLFGTVLPGLQTHSLLPGTESTSRSQSVHVPAPEAEIFPPSQLTQSPAPLKSLCCPRIQPRHTLLSGPVYQLLHLQSMISVFLISECISAGHVRHVADTVGDLYAPAGQRTSQESFEDNSFVLSEGEVCP